EQCIGGFPVPEVHTCTLPNSLLRRGPAPPRPRRRRRRVLRRARRGGRGARADRGARARGHPRGGRAHAARRHHVRRRGMPQGRRLGRGRDPCRVAGGRVLAARPARAMSLAARPVGTARLALEYVLPLRSTDGGDLAELTDYLTALATWVDVTVVDGSPRCTARCSSRPAATKAT